MSPVIDTSAKNSLSCGLSTKLQYSFKNLTLSTFGIKSDLL